jgi:hypothetical protein
MLLEEIQTHLETIYGTRCGLSVSDFLVEEDLGDRESVFVRETDDAFELKVFVPRALHELPMSSLFNAPAKFFEAVEGVSHFLYLCRSAELERQVSMLELETQAEVDKFASAALIRWNQGVRAAGELHRQLFERISFAPQFGEHERWRYEEANRLASRYCERLLSIIAQRRLDRLLTELRESYRMGAEAKLAYLGAR